jgi:hypothetical protein
MMAKKDKKHPGWRIPYSVITSVGWLVFLILWLAFYASEYSIYQNIAIVIASILVLFFLTGSVWMIWIFSMMSHHQWKMVKESHVQGRVTISILLPILALVFLVIWFFFHADSFNIYQNIAVFFVTILVMGGILGAIWSHWKTAFPDMDEKMEEMGKEFGEEIERTFDKE